MSVPVTYENEPQDYISAEGVAAIPEVASRLLESQEAQLAIIKGLDVGSLLESAEVFVKAGGLAAVTPDMDGCLTERLANARVSLERGVRLLVHSAELDQVVSQWWSSVESTPKKCRPVFDDQVRVVTRGIDPHIDDFDEGPLTFSLRVDTSEASRHFYARKSMERNVIDRDLTSSPDWFALSNEAGQMTKTQMRRELTAIEQSRGDLVLFMNSPHSSLHGVEVSPKPNYPKNSTIALIGGYVLEKLPESY